MDIMNEQQAIEAAKDLEIGGSRVAYDINSNQVYMIIKEQKNKVVALKNSNTNMTYINCSDGTGLLGVMVETSTDTGNKQLTGILDIKNKNIVDILNNKINNQGYLFFYAVSDDLTEVSMKSIFEGNHEGNFILKTKLDQGLKNLSIS